VKVGVAGYWVDPHPPSHAHLAPQKPAAPKLLEEKEECHNHFFILQILLSVLK